MNDTDLQRRAAGLAVDAWEGLPAGAKADVFGVVEAFLAGHARGWADRARRDDEPPDGAVVLLYRPSDAERTLVYRRRDEWIDPDAQVPGARWYLLGMPGDYEAPSTWADLLASGTVTELIEGDMTWPA